MPCPACQHENPITARFCNQCGHALAAPDPRPVPAPPAHLVAKVRAARPLEGARKHVTVLFADVQGSMNLAERIDPEEWHAILDRFVAILADGVHRFEGTVNQFTGDGIMALFGAPIAHEDHARRACWAALHLQEAMRRYADRLRLERGLSFSVRMGINSGEVVIGRIGDDLRMDATAHGHTVGLAARMEALAEPGAVYLTEHTARLVAGYCRLRDLGPLTIKGAQAPLRVHVLEGVGPLRTRLEASRARGFSRFVGRTAEMDRLDRALDRALAGGGAVVGVVGEPGVGKSRLCWEFTERCRARGLAVLTGQAVAYGNRMPLLPVLQILRAHFGISEKTAAATARERVAGKLLLLDRGLEDTLPLVFEFLGVPDPERPAPPIEPEARQHRLFTVVRRLTQARNREPAVILCEDLHWLDGASEAFVEQWVDAVPGTRTVLLVNYRPGYQAAWMQRAHVESLALAPLGAGAISELLQDLLGTDASLDVLATLIRERTGGNPFFIEELVRDLVERGEVVGERGQYRLEASSPVLTVPPTVQSILAARIDRLPEREKHVLHTAAVIGKRFTRPLLEAIADVPSGELDDVLRALLEAEFVLETALWPVVEYEFKHRLTLEVALGSQLSDRRMRMHGRVAEVLEVNTAGGGDERAAVLAHHWENAGRAFEAARWHRRAADWVGMSDASEAWVHWERVRALLGEAGDVPGRAELELAACTQMLNLGWRIGAEDVHAAELFADGRAIAERAGDHRALALLSVTYGIVRGVAGDLAAYVQHSRDAVDLAAQVDDAALTLIAGRALAAALSHMGRLRESQVVATRMLARHPADLQLGADVWGFSPFVYVVALNGMLTSLMGDPATGCRQLDRAAELARSQGDLELLLFAQFFYVSQAEVAGDVEGAMVRARQVGELAEKLGVSIARIHGAHALTIAHVLRGAWSEAAAAAEEVLALVRARGGGLYVEGAILACAAEARRGLGDLPQALALAEEAVATCARLGTRHFQVHAELALARTHRSRGAREATLGALDRADALVTETGAEGYRPIIARERAALSAPADS